MSYSILTSKQIVVLETLAAMDKSSTAWDSWSLAWEIFTHSQNCHYWDAVTAENSLERSVASVLAYLERKGLVKSYFSTGGPAPSWVQGPSPSSFKMWYLSLLGSEVAGVETSG